MQKPRIAVVGYGHLGRHHARLLAESESCELVAVADARPEAAAAARDAHGVLAVTDYRDLTGQIDAASVVVPTKNHREVAGFLLEQGVHCLVEKPITPTAAEGLELVELAESRGLVLQVGHIERFNSAFVALQESGLAPRYIESQRLAPFSFRSTDVGVVLDLMVHDLDLVLALVGSEVVDVQAFGGAVFTPAEDMASATLKFANGAVAQLSASRVALKPLRRLRVFSREGYASADFSDRHVLVIRKNDGWDFEKLDVANVDTSKIDDLWKFVFDGLLSVQNVRAEERNALKDELEAFCATIRDGGEPRVTGRQGVRAVEVALQIVQAIREHPW